MIPLLFIIAFPFLLYRGKKKVRAARASANWPAVPGRIASAVTRSFRLIHQQPHFTYDYVVNGQPFTGSRITYAGVVSPRRTDEYLAKYPRGSAVTVHYCPDAPSDSVIEAGDAELLEQANRWLVYSLVGIIAINVLAFAIRSKTERDEEAERRPIPTYGDPGTMSEPTAAARPTSLPAAFARLPLEATPPPPVTDRLAEEAARHLAGRYTFRNHRRGRASLAIDVEIRAERAKATLELGAAHLDGSGAAPTGEATGQVDAAGTFRGGFVDSFGNEGGVLVTADKLSIKIAKVADPRCLVFYGDHPLTRLADTARE